MEGGGLAVALNQEDFLGRADNPFHSKHAALWERQYGHAGVVPPGGYRIDGSGRLHQIMEWQGAIRRSR